MQTIVLQPFFHRGEECIGLAFTHSKTLSGIVQKLPEAKWSRTRNCWYIACTREACAKFLKAIEGKAAVDTAL